MMVLYEKYLLSGKDNIITVESGKSSRILPYDFSRPRCDLFWRDGMEFGHLECLKSQNYAYRKEFGWACVFCKRTVLNVSNIHQCAKHKICFLCKRIIVQPNWNALIYKASKKMFCYDKIAKERGTYASFEIVGKLSEMSCKKCRLVFQSENCFKGHKSICTSREQCKKCEQVLYFPFFDKGRRDLMRNEHKKVCGSENSRLCQFCLTCHGPNNECKLQPTLIKDFENFPKLMIVSGAISFLDKELCFECYSTKSLCHLHDPLDPKQPFVNYLCILREEKTHGTFLKEFVTERGIMKNLEEIHQPYKTTTSQTSDVQKKTNYGRIKKDRTKPFVLEIEPRTAMDVLLREALLNPKLSNCIAVIEQHLMPFVFESLVHFKLPLPGVIGGVIDLPTVSFRFVSVNNYLADYRKFANLTQTKFFPMMANREESFGSKKPHLSYFLCLTDTFDEIAKKKDYYENIHAVYDFEEELRSFLYENCSHIMISMVKLADLTYDIQNHLIFKHLNIKNIHLQNIRADQKKPGSIFRCYNSNGFFYHLLLYYATNNKMDLPLYSLKHGETGIYSSNCSEPEFMFQNYIKYKRPNCKLYGSHISSYGCKKFKKNYPDMYDESKGEIIHFHGMYLS